MCFSVDGVMAAEENVSVTIDPFSTLTYTFATPVDLSAADTYDIKVWVEIAGDADHNNDTSIKTIKNKVCFISSFPYKFDFQENNFNLFSCWEVLAGDPDNMNIYNVGIYYDIVGASDTNYFWGFFSYHTVDNGDYSIRLISPDLVVTADNKMFYFKYRVDNASKPETFAVGYISNTDIEVWLDTVTTSATDWMTYINIDIPNNAKKAVFKYMSSKKEYLFVDDIIIRTANTDLYVDDLVNLVESVTVRMGDTVKIPVTVNVKNDGMALPSMTAEFGYKIEKISGTAPVEIKNVHEVYATDIAAVSTFNYTFADSAVFTDTGTYKIRVWAVAPNNANSDTIDAEIAIEAGTIAIDLIVEEIIEPAAVSNQDLSNAEKITVTIKNNGYEDAASYKMYLSVNGGTPIVENVSAPIRHYRSISYTFTNSADLSATNTYNIRVWAEIAGDANHANDTATKTLTNVNCLISDYPFVEDFESPLTVCWQYHSANAENEEDLCRVSGDEALNGSYAWQFSSYNIASDYSQYLVSPQLSTDKVKTVSFYSKSLYAEGSAFESLVVGYSTTDNSIESFTWCTPYGPPVVGSWTKHIEYGIPPTAKYVAIKYMASRDWYSVYIDSLVIDGKNPVAADLAVTEIISPVMDNIDLSDEEEVTVALRTCGSVRTSSCKMYLSVNGKTPIEEICTTPIEPYEVFTYTFTNLVNLSAAADHSIKVWVEIAGDADSSNDTVSKVIKNKVCPISSFPYTLYFEDDSYDFLDCWSFSMGNENNQNIESTGLYYDEETGNYFWAFVSYLMVDDGDYSMYLISPDLAKTSDEKIFSFDYRVNDGSVFVETFAVGYVSTADEFVWLDTVDVTVWEWTNYTGAAIPGDAKRVVFKYMSSEKMFLFIDNITVSSSNVGLPVNNSVDMPVTVYPNPSDGNFKVNVADRTEMEIINHGGVVVQRKTISGLSEFSLYARGLYLLRFSGENGRTAIRKLIVK
jgi:hypothetical protein